MKKAIALCLTAVLYLCCLTSCGFFTPTIERFIPDEQIASVEIKTTNYETGIDEITEKYVLSADQSNEIKLLLKEITYAKRYNILQEKWTYFNDVQYIFTFETQKVCLSENHIYIYDSNDTLIKHVEFNSSTFNDYLEQIISVLASCNCNHYKPIAIKYQNSDYAAYGDAFLGNLLNNSKWHNDVAKCECDYTIRMKDEREIFYHSESGTFVDYDFNKSLTIREEDRVKLNAYFVDSICGSEVHFFDENQRCTACGYELSK